jgi:hypothetical protein
MISTLQGKKKYLYLKHIETAHPSALRTRRYAIPQGLHRSTPITVGLSRVELLTSRLSGVRSNHLSYRPNSFEEFGMRADKLKKVCTAE